MSAVEELERSIIDARGRGDTATLQRLQARYRKEATPIRITGPGSIRLVERSSQSSVAVESAPTVTAETGTVKTVVVRPEARFAIRNLELSTDREAGGWLVGHEDGDELVVVETIYGARAGAGGHTGERNEVKLDAEWLGVVDERALRGGWKVIGDWHSHPVPSGPSGRDEHGWLGQAKGLRQNYIGVVVCPHEADMLEDTDRFRRPQWTAFVASPDGQLRPIALTFELSPEGE